ncbi:hypothetical protein PT974_11251 [Cladobotryum mycophilum]|uniref:DUF1279 domain-containing protein n=1 Tax=Cladobotryum mycophilum TaxID=491253 RepID=A0ABR0S4T0_9HYPO
MLQTPLKLGAQPLKGATARSILPSGAWRRFFASPSQPAGRSYSSIWRPRPGPTEALQGITRHAAASRSSYGAAQRLSGGFQRRGFRFSAWRRSNDSAKKAQESLSLTDRLKKLSKEYGWAAVGVYLGLSVLDFPFCFLLVRVVGTDRIGQFEQFIVSKVGAIIPETVRDKISQYWHSLKNSEAQQLGDSQITDKAEMVGWGVEQAQERNKEEASLATQLALAYAIHKSFIFLRVPLTAAVTPKVVKVLRSWGWNIGKKTTR